MAKRHKYRTYKTESRARRRLAELESGERPLLQPVNPGAVRFGVVPTRDFRYAVALIAESGAVLALCA